MVWSKFWSWIQHSQWVSQWVSDQGGHRAARAAKKYKSCFKQLSYFNSQIFGPLVVSDFHDKMAPIFSWKIWIHLAFCVLLCRRVVAGNLWNLLNLLDLFDLWVLRWPVSRRHLDVAPRSDIHSCVGWSFLQAALFLFFLCLFCRELHPYQSSQSNFFGSSDNIDYGGGKSDNNRFIRFYR